jgi:hypothetical protein
MGYVAIKGNRVSYKKAASVTLVALRFVKLASATTITPISGATDIPIGVLVKKTAREDYPAPVQIDGIIDVEVGTAGATFGHTLKMDADGCVVDGDTVASGEVIVGTALETGTDGNYIKVKLNPCPFNLA